MAANDETRKKEPKKKASFDGTADAFLFAAGAAAFAARWEKKRIKDEDASSSSASSLACEVTVRWVDEPDPLVRRRVAPGYLVLEGARVDVVEDDVFEDDVFEEEDDAFFQDAAEEDDQAARFRFPAKEKEDH
jgi:predicted Mrr-cat superfamily restriction endonuclease